MKVAVGSDHAGFMLKEEVTRILREAGVEYEDFGVYTLDSADYPDTAKKVARAVANGEFDRGILVCASGIGMSIAANKVKGIRAALCGDEMTARLSREHNDANILVMGALVTNAERAAEIIRVWLSTEFSGEERHARRVRKIGEL